MSGELEITTREGETFNWLRNKQQSIIFLQEVHCTEATIDTWRSEWGYKALFSCLSSSSAGVCILFNNNFKFDILKTFWDPSGRYAVHVCDIKTDEKLFTFANMTRPLLRKFLTAYTILRARKYSWEVISILC